MKRAIIAIGLMLVISTGIGAYFLSSHVSSNAPVGTVRLLAAASSLDQAATRPSSRPTVQDVVVTFSRIEIHAADAGSDSGWHPITVGSMTIHLIQPLSVSTLLGSASLPTGKYDQIRLFAQPPRVVIKNPNGVLENVVFNIPSAKTGIKVPIEAGGFMLTAGTTTNVVLSLSFNSHDILAQLHRSVFHNIVPVMQAKVQ